ncbi:hypothetical protein [Novipirellula rosea]|uniref:Zinc-finger domain-containing protein n=1 Tax=Novipirellula rosea TaxID=1031540 RepID=A0ABP8ND14_9BACT
MSLKLLTDDAPLDPDDELLVAYVDGELDHDSRTQLESRLLDDAELRRRLQSLQQGWDYLDDFPALTPCEKLVESTLELVVSDIVKPTAESSASRVFVNRFRWPLITAGLCVLGILAAAATIYGVRSFHYQSQLEDLAIAENIDAYYYGRDLQLMRDLALNESWTNMVTAMKDIGDLSPPEPIVSNVDLSEREDLIETLSLVQRSHLDSNWKRFTRLDEQDQQQIRQTAERVQAEPNADVLLQTMQIYSAWRETLSSELRDKIEADDLDQRREAIKQAIDQTQLAMSKRSSLNLSDDTIERIAFALHQILKMRLQNEDPGATKFISRLKQFVDSERAELMAVGAMVFGDVGRPDGRGGRFGFPRGPSDRGPNDRGSSGNSLSDRPAPLTIDELAMIEIILSDADRDVLDSIAGDPRNPMMEAVTLRYWAEETVKRKAWSRNENETTLVDRYQQLDPHDRELIDLLPAKQAIDRLTPSYRRGP